MKKEEADLAQRYNVGVIIKRPEYDGKIYFIKSFIRWRDPRLSNRFEYSVQLENQNEPRRGVVQIDIMHVEIMPGWKEFIKKKLDERAEQQAFDELKKKINK